jgi:methyl coenzyme M reductase subunit D
MLRTQAERVIPRVLEGPVRGDPHGWQERAGHAVDGEAMEIRIAAARQTGTGLDSGRAV